MVEVMIAKKDLKYDLGIVGGMGPEATAYFYKMLIDDTDVSKEQEHLSIVILSQAKIPDRTKHILSGGKDPYPMILETIQTLDEMGVDKIVMPCNTAHYYQDKIKKEIGLKFISLIDETINYLKKHYKDHTIVLLSTEATSQLKIYQTNVLNFKYLEQPQQDKVSKIIQDVKTQNESLTLIGQRLNELIHDIDKGNYIYLLGCTELSLLEAFIHKKTVDPLKVMSGVILNK